jgi:single-strand DNA-binding protein
MNKAIEIGRLTRDPEVRYSQGNNTAVARYTIAVDRKFKREGEQTADFIPCVVFGKQAEFAEKYFRKGTKVVISGRITTGSYTNKDGQKIYTTEITVEEQEFAEEVVRNSGYRWFVIKCGDGTGIVHAGSYYACAVYGKLDTDGCIAEPYGYIYLTDNGFIYEE